MAFDKHSRNAIFDKLCELKDAGAITASVEGKVDGSAVEFDTGGGRTLGNVVVDVSAMEADSSDELYVIKLQGSNVSGFATELTDLVAISLGYDDVLVADEDKGVDRYIFPFTNVFGKTTYRYLRIYCEISGTMVTGINFSSFLTK